MVLSLCRFLRNAAGRGRGLVGNAYGWCVDQNAIGRVSRAEKVRKLLNK